MVNKAERNLSYKLTIVLIALALIEGIIKALWQVFPLTEIFAFQLAIASAWFAKRAVTDIKSYKYHDQTVKPD